MNSRRNHTTNIKDNNNNNNTVINYTARIETRTNANWNWPSRFEKRKEEEGEREDGENFQIYFFYSQFSSLMNIEN